MISSCLRRGFGSWGWLVVMALCVAVGLVREAQAQIYVTNSTRSVVEQYSLTGMPLQVPIAMLAGNVVTMAQSNDVLYVATAIDINRYDVTFGSKLDGGNFINSATFIGDLKIDGNTLYVLKKSGDISVYDISQSAPRLTLEIPCGAGLPLGTSGWTNLGLSGGTLYCANSSNGLVARYNALSGTCDGSVLVSGIMNNQSIFAADKLYTIKPSQGFVRIYTADGFFVDSVLVNNLNDTSSISVAGDSLYVLNGESGTISEYNLVSKALVNANVGSGLGLDKSNLLVVPEPSCVALLVGGALFGLTVVRRRAA